MSARKVIELGELRVLRERLRAEGRTVVQCHGCFDIVHPGHVRYLQFAREQGDVLVVSVSADDVVGKGAERPYINQELRLENLAALECVDFVVLDHETWAGPILEAVRPDVYVKGKEYERNGDPRFLKEKQLVEDYGGRVVFSSGDVIYSSTFIVNAFKERFALEQEKVAIYCRRHGITRAGIDGLMARFRGRRILVLADPILDRYVHCDADGLASDCPVLSVTPIRDDWYAGAGALVAGQIAALGAHATLLTPLGSGQEAARFVAAVDELGVELQALPTDERPVFLKTRYLVDERQVFKVDAGGAAPPSTRATRQLLAALEAQLPRHDALLVSDFGYGLFNADVAEAVQTLSDRHGKPYFADVSSRRVTILKFRGPRLVTPSEEELRFAFADNESGITHLAAKFYRATGAGNLVLTLGKRGVLLFGPPGPVGVRLKTDYLPSLAPAAIDPIGAGDVFLAGAALTSVVGASVAEGAYLGSCLAAAHVARMGNAPVGGLALAQLLDHREELRAQGDA